MHSLNLPRVRVLDSMLGPVSSAPEGEEILLLVRVGLNGNEARLLKVGILISTVGELELPSIEIRAYLK